MRLKALFITLLISVSSLSQRDIQKLIFQGEFILAQETISNQLKIKNLPKYQKAELYHLEGDMFKIAGDIDGALISWQKAALIRDELYPDKTDYHHSWKYAHLSNFHYEKINTSLAKVYADSCLQLIDKLTTKEQMELEIFKIWNILGQSIKQQSIFPKTEFDSLYERCVQFYENSILFQLEHSTPKHYLANTYHLLGNAHLDMTFHYKSLGLENKAIDFQERSLAFYDLAIQIWQQKYGTVHYELAKTLFIKGLLFHYFSISSHNINNSIAAIEYFEQSIAAFGLDVSEVDNISLKSIPNKEDLLMCLKYYTTNLLKLHDEALESNLYLSNAEKVNKLAVVVWEEIHQSFNSENTNQNLAIYNLIPQEASIAILFRKNPSAETNEQFLQLNQKLKYFDLHKEQVNKQQTSITQIQKQLTSNQQFLDFHFSADNQQLYALCISKNEHEIIAIPESIRDVILKYKTSIIELNYDAFVETSHSIYSSFFPNGASPELIICPDVFVAEIPFESLLRSKKNANERDYRKLDYLINSVSIQYVLTPSSFSNEVKKIPWELSVLTPSFDNIEYSELPFSKQLGERLKQNFDADLHLGAMATSQALQKTNGSILHLSTHSVVGDDPTMNYVQLADGPLYQSEFNHMVNTPTLFVINSCNSGMGKNIMGDGINGIVRELHRMGVNATISNLWEVDDQVSNDLFFDFYTSLNEGKNTSDALRGAKLNHLKKAPSAELGAPYYWAGHRMVGREIISRINRSYLWLAWLISLPFIFWIILKLRVLIKVKSSD